ncbi:myb-like protein I [Scylla paramamosain]|uniref:myb-like protein I n=1 Tax=Scylla paramamosain TaxID=85552 RepID=UPI00308320B2
MRWRKRRKKKRIEKSVCGCDKVTELAGLKEELQILASRHVADNWRIKRTEEATWGHGSLSSAYHVLSQLSFFPKLYTSTPLAQQLQQYFLRLLTVRVNRSSTASEVVRPRIKREDRGVMYLPVRGGGGGAAAACPSYADTVSASLTQMAFASVAVTVFNTVFNIVNNINNNNNNNNVNSNNNVASNNANAASNNNNGNQVDVVLPPPVGRRRRHEPASAWTLAPTTGENLVDVSHTRDSLHFIRGSIEDMDGCLPRKTYARAALATLRALQDILHSPSFACQEDEGRVVATQSFQFRRSDAVLT